MAGIQNIKEVLAAVDLVALSGIEIAKGGLAWDDVPKAMELAKQYEALVAAVKNIEEIVVEAKDLDAVEASELLGLVIELVKKIKAAA